MIGYIQLAKEPVELSWTDQVKPLSLTPTLTGNSNNNNNNNNNNTIPATDDNNNNNDEKPFSLLTAEVDIDSFSLALTGCFSQEVVTTLHKIFGFGGINHIIHHYFVNNRFIDSLYILSIPRKGEDRMDY